MLTRLVWGVVRGGVVVSCVAAGAVGCSNDSKGDDAASASATDEGATDDEGDEDDSGAETDDSVGEADDGGDLDDADDANGANGADDGDGPASDDAPPGTEDEPSLVAQCDPGDTRECVGPGACAGGQLCRSDGQWGGCDCGDGVVSEGEDATDNGAAVDDATPDVEGTPPDGMDDPPGAEEPPPDVDDGMMAEMTDGSSDTDEPPPVDEGAGGAPNPDEPPDGSGGGSAGGAGSGEPTPGGAVVDPIPPPATGGNDLELLGRGLIVSPPLVAETDPRSGESTQHVPDLGLYFWLRARGAVFETSLVPYEGGGRYCARGEARRMDTYGNLPPGLYIYWGTLSGSEQAGTGWELAEWSAVGIVFDLQQAPPSGIYAGVIEAQGDPRYSRRELYNGRRVVLFGEGEGFNIDAFVDNPNRLPVSATDEKPRGLVFMVHTDLFDSDTDDAAYEFCVSNVRLIRRIE